MSMYKSSVDLDNRARRMAKREVNRAMYEKRFFKKNHRVFVIDGRHACAVYFPRFMEGYTVHMRVVRKPSGHR